MEILTNYSTVPRVNGGAATALLPPYSYHLLKPSIPHPNFSTSKPSSSLSLSSSKPLSLLSAPSTPHPPKPTFADQTRHNRAATGYATALVDFSRRGGTSSLNAIAIDVNRLTAFVAAVRGDPSMDDQERTESVRAALEVGGFDRRLVALVRMVAAKPKGLSLIADVLKEFWRSWREVTGAAEAVEVVVAAERKMGVEELATIAREVQRAHQVVQVKIKHLFCP